MIDTLIIEGATKLSGEIEISGAKNAILPILAASLICKKEIIIENVPNLSDVKIMLQLLEEVGSKSEFDIKNNRLTIFAKDHIASKITNAELCEKVRTSSLFLGPILAINGEVTIPEPGGCKIGARLIDMHLHFLQEMGAQLKEENCTITLKSNKKLFGINANFYKTSVGATQNIMIAASLADGETTIYGASIEPEVTDLGNFLISLGVKIEGLGTSTIKIYGATQDSLSQKEPYKIICDRLEVGTYAILALATKSELFLKNGCYGHLEYFFNILKSIGGKIDIKENGILISNNLDKILAKSIVTAPYPYFPTDLQQIYTTLMCIADGASIIEEKIFDGRFKFTEELKKMGAKIYQENENKIIVEGVEKLQASEIYTNDLRGSMALIIAAIMANGTSIVHNAFYAERGYENFIEKLTKIGVKIFIK